MKLLIESAVHRGTITLDGKSDADIAESIKTFLSSVRSGDVTFALGTDHSQDLRTEAERLHEAGRHELAITMHATSVEHWLNSMLRSGAERMGLEEPDTTQMIRDASLRAKAGWLWKLLFDADFPPEIRQQIVQLSNRRNAFVHYKWPAESGIPSEMDAEMEKLRAISASGPELLDELAALEDALLFAERRDALHRVLSSWSAPRNGNASTTPRGSDG